MVLNYDPITDKDGKDVFNEMLIKKLSGFDNSLPDEFKLPTSKSTTRLET